MIDLDLSKQLERFWMQEEAVVSKPALTVDEIECENHFARTHSRDSSGRYILRLPFNSKLNQLGDSRQAALSSLYRMEDRFKRQPQLFDKYSDFINEYESLGHLRRTLSHSKEATKNSFFLPHHGVLKSTGSLRVVFNGSFKPSAGVSINDCLYTGPNLLLDITDVLLRWRLHRYTFTTDIVKMFRQILIHPEDQHYQKILWRSNADEETQTLILNTVTYGLVCAPYQANRTMRQLAVDESKRFPQASSVLLRNLYMDDILSGADTIEDAIALKTELIDLLMAGGFPLSKWTSNDPRILSDIPDNQRATSEQVDWPQPDSYHMLGLSWRSSDDSFHFRFKRTDGEEVITKRKALSLTAQLYDPLGWLSPLTITLKIFLQSLWHYGIEWDDSLPPQLLEKWNQAILQFQDLESFALPRWIFLSRDCDLIELHGFSDASERAYAACIYLRTRISKGNVNSTFLIGKSKVSPLKQVSLPRLELCGAVLLTRLMKRVKDTLSINEVSCHMWTDSTITLSWIRGHPSSWKTYVANRVSEIQTSLPQAIWHHVSGKENPADLASRGVSYQELINSQLWPHGPPFLRSNRSNWSNESDLRILEDCPEKRGLTSLITRSSPEEPQLLLKYSTLKRLLRVTAWCQVYITKLSQHVHQLKSKKLIIIAANSTQIDELTPQQLEDALKLWIRKVQSLFFFEDLNSISKGNKLSSKSSLIRLSPFIDDTGVLRVGGRLRHSLLHPDEKNPIILPKTSFLTKLIVREAHVKTMHGGTQLTLSYLRRRFWILKGRQVVKSVIFKCLPCWRQRAAPSTQLMGDLPSARVQPHRAFLHTGIDYAGPINLRLSKGRGTKSYKGYVAVFVCLATRAIHLEVDSGYSTEDFLNVFRRFTARRGICAVLYSDFGTNFAGASKELRTLLEQAKAQSSEIARQLANDGTQ